MKEIGGYFNLELSQRDKTFLHSDGICLNTGRNALEYILASLPRIAKIWIPYFTCEVILEPIEKMNIPYSFYSINDRLEIAEKPSLLLDEYIIVTNYFGVKDQYINDLAEEFGERLIVDNAQAFFCKPLPGIKTIYSPRKFVGVPDGGIAYIDDGVDIDQCEQDISYYRCSHLLKRIDLGSEAGYRDFKENSYKLGNQSIKKMSNLTYNLLNGIDFDFVRECRVKNFHLLSSALSTTNCYTIPSLDTFACPMVYPYYVMDVGLKKRLIDNKIFVATYWPNIVHWCDDDSIEFNLMNKMLALPIDQRYGSVEMQYIIAVIKNG